MRAGCSAFLAAGFLFGCAAAGAAAASPAFSTIHSFSCRDDGAFPHGTLVTDGAGVLYGTTESGGVARNGNAFALTESSGGWSESVFYSFNGGSEPDGFAPQAGLAFGPDGRLYGTTAAGGSTGANFGTVFQLRPQADGSWSEQILHNFSGGAGGGIPRGPVVFDAAGALYGATTGDGSSATDGTAFKLTRRGTGWGFQTLRRFNGRDGAFPKAGLIIDAAGVLYGTTEAGGRQTGTSAGGVVFALFSTGAGDKWQEQILFDFGAGAGNSALLQSGLLLDGAGNLYGTRYASAGGLLAGPGAVFELSPPGAGAHWHYRNLHTFNGSDGAHPQAELIFDAAGNLYGTTNQGGAGGLGTVFRLKPNAAGRWVEQVLHSFNRDDGAFPDAGLVFGKSGLLYGTTTQGGGQNCGTVFALRP